MAIGFDTVAAVSTPPGKGGVAIIRLSGSSSLDIIRKIFLPARSGLTEITPRYQTYGYVVEDGERIDDVLLTVFRGPNSYTGEDMAEICCHGGVGVTAATLGAVLRAGARHAEGGEFTRRAFINGKLSLTDAEAIGNLLDATGREQIKLNSKPSRTKLDERIEGMRKELVSLMSSIYARIDYPDEDLGDFTDGEVLKKLSLVLEDGEKLLSTYSTGRAINEGVKAVICGKPNVGKSSLYNMLVGEDAAIVTDIEGTTRDVLERVIHLGKVTLRLYDTAGIRQSCLADTVERIGIEKSKQMIEECELIFALFDISRPLDRDDLSLIEHLKEVKAHKIAVLTKSDLDAVLCTDKITDSGFETVIVSTKDDAASISRLKEVTEKRFTDGSIVIGEDAVISNARQHAALKSALDYVKAAIDCISLGFLQDAASSDIERAIGALGELDGREVGDLVVEDIFSRFCVGK